MSRRPAFFFGRDSQFFSSSFFLRSLRPRHQRCTCSVVGPPVRESSFLSAVNAASAVLLGAPESCRFPLSTLHVQSCWLSHLGVSSTRSCCQHCICSVVGHPFHTSGSLVVQDSGFQDSSIKTSGSTTSGSRLLTQDLAPSSHLFYTVCTHHATRGLNTVGSMYFRSRTRAELINRSF